MKRNRTYKTRILLFGLVVATLVAGAAAFYVVRKHQIAQRFARMRSEGLAAWAAGDAKKACDLLGPVLQRNMNDQEALTAYAAARPNVALPQNQEVRETILVLRHLLSLNPNLLPQRRALLDLYAKTGYVTETVDVADTILASAPRDTAALRQKTLALTRLQRWPQALECCDKWVAADPKSVEAELLALQVMHELRRAGEEIIGRARARHDAAPGDPRGETILGFAYALAGRKDDATKMLAAAAARSSVDAELGAVLVPQLDAAGLHDESFALLKRLSAQTNDAQFQTAIARRKWELNDSKGALTEIDRLTAIVGEAGVPADLRAIKVLAGRAVSEKQGKVAVAATWPSEQFVAGADDLEAQAWSLLLGRNAGDRTIDPKRVNDACSAALQRQPNAPFLRHFLAETALLLGDVDRAIEEWNEQLRTNRTWPLPAMRLGETLASRGRYKQAMVAVGEAYRRAPKDPAIRLAIYRTWANCIEAGEVGGADKLLGLVDEVQRQAPGEEQTLTIKLGLLARSKVAGDRDKAIALMRQMLARTAPVSEECLLRMAGLSRSAKLGLEAVCFDRSEHEHGLTPSLAFARAADEFSAGRVKEGASLLERAKASAGASGNSKQWKLAWARYLDLTQDARAKEALTALGDEFPTDLTVQQLVLGSRTVQSERELILRTLDRVRALVGDQGNSWRIGKARWLAEFAPLSGAERQKTMKQASGLLEEVVRSSPEAMDARALLARVKEALGDLPGAIEQLDAAADLDPTATRIVLEQVRLLQASGDFAKARDRLARLSEDPMQDPQQRRQAAVLLARQGETQLAVSLLNSVQGQRDSDLLLGQLYAVRGEYEKAEAISRKLLGEPDVQSIALTAEVYARMGRPADAANALAQLDKLKLEPGVKELVRGDHAFRFEGPAAAVAAYRNATKAAPKDPRGWRQLIAACAAAGDAATALAAARDALAAVPGDVGIQTFNRESELAAAAIRDPDCRPFAQSLLRSVDESTPALELLRLEQAAKVQKRSADDQLARLDQLADRYARYIPLQIFVAKRFLDERRLQEAANVAARAEQASPDSVEPVRLAAGVFATSGRWNEALEAAKTWRSRAITDAADADVVVSECQIQLGDPAAAVRQLEPYVISGRATGKGSEVVLTQYAHALALTGRSGELPALVEPVLRRDARWRMTWLSFVVQTLSEPVAEDWLTRIGPMMPPDKVEEQVVLSEAWGRLGARFGNAKYAKTARQILDKLLAQAGTSPAALVAMGARLEQDGEARRAEQMYRRALQIDPKQFIAENNLAMLLSQNQLRLVEAKRLSEAAVAQQPGVAAVHDTLAQILAKLGDKEAAVQSVAHAARLAPGDPLYRVRYAELLAAAGQGDQASRVIGEIDVLFANDATFTKPLRQRVEQLRQTLNRSSSANGAARM